jgi:hypothetical protein
MTIVKAAASNKSFLASNIAHLTQFLLKRHFTSHCARASLSFLGHQVDGNTLQTKPLAHRVRNFAQPRRRQIRRAGAKQQKRGGAAGRLHDVPATNHSHPPHQYPHAHITPHHTTPHHTTPHHTTPHHTTPHHTTPHHTTPSLQPRASARRRRMRPPPVLQPRVQLLRTLLAARFRVQLGSSVQHAVDAPAPRDKRDSMRC